MAWLRIQRAVSSPTIAAPIRLPISRFIETSSLHEQLSSRAKKRSGFVPETGDGPRQSVKAQNKKAWKSRLFITRYHFLFLVS